jgi:hypothetical protein
MKPEQIAELVRAARTHADRGDRAEALKVAAPLRAALSQIEAAHGLLHLIAAHSFERDDGRSILREVFDAYPGDASVAVHAGSAYEGAHDVRYLNAAPPEDDLPSRIADRLVELAETVADAEAERALHFALASVARLLGRSWDEVAERSYRRILELVPDRWQMHYDFGLFLKTRGRFAEGMEANQRAWKLGGSDDESLRWNLGICATGAGNGTVAREAWTALGLAIETGRFDLPEGSFASVKVRLAERPLAERGGPGVPDDPGQEETIWIERLSPCHGIVRSALFYELGVDYGDVVIFDGAPITHQAYGDQKVPVFPHLATLKHRGYQRYPFAGTQQAQRQLAELGADLPDDTVIYVHTEQVVHLCSACWEETSTRHKTHATSEHRVVTGKLCAPPEIPPAALLAAVDRLLAAAPGLRLFVPDLADAAGDTKRRDVEQRRHGMLTDGRG